MTDWLILLFGLLIGYACGAATTVVVLRVRHRRELVQMHYETRRQVLLDPEAAAQRALTEEAVAMGYWDAEEGKVRPDWKD